MRNPYLTTDDMPARRTPTPPARSQEPRPQPQRISNVGTLLAACLVLIPVAAPLFALALMLQARENALVFVDSQRASLVFRVSMREGVSIDEAGEFADRQEDTPDWETARVMEGRDPFLDVPELAEWLEKSENRALTGRVPPLVDLVPARLFDRLADGDALERSLRDRPEVADVVYNRDAARWLTRWAEAVRSLTWIVSLGLGALALVGAFFAGWAHARLFRVGARERQGWRAFLAHGPSAVLICVGGLLAVLLSGIFHAVATPFLDVEIVWLSTWSASALIAGGVVLGLFAWSVRYVFERAWGGNMHVTATLALCLVGMAAQAQDTSMLALPDVSEPRVETTEARPALPVLDTGAQVGFSANISTMGAEERAELAERYAERARENEQAISFLREWLERNEQERRVGEQNRDAVERSLAAAWNEYRISRDVLDERMDSIDRMREGLTLVRRRPERDGPIVDPTARLDRMLARYLLVNEAEHHFTVLEYDRRKMRLSQDRLEQVRRETARLEAFQRHASQSPEQASEELARLEAKRERIATHRVLLASPPVVAPRRERFLVAAAQDSPPDVPRDAGYLLLVEPGAPIHAVLPGKVLHASAYRGMGGMVTISHDRELSTLYAYLAEEEIGVHVGEVVKTGQYIGTAGLVPDRETGGIRFEARREGELVEITELPGITAENLDERLLGEPELQPRALQP